jgi:hypothetical protein
MAHPREADDSFYPGKFGPNLKKRYAIWCLDQKHCSKEIAVNRQRMCMKNNTYDEIRKNLSGLGNHVIVTLERFHPLP